MKQTELPKFITDKNSNEFKMNKHVKDFFEANSIEEVSDILGLMLENYVGTSPTERNELAATTYFINRLIFLMFNLDALTKEDASNPSVHVGKEQECTHN